MGKWEVTERIRTHWNPQGQMELMKTNRNLHLFLTFSNVNDVGGLQQDLTPYTMELHMHLAPALTEFESKRY